MPEPLDIGNVMSLREELDAAIDGTSVGGDIVTVARNEELLDAIVGVLNRRQAGDTELPRGLTISEDSKLLNWRGVNYVRQGDPYAFNLDLGNIIMQVQIQTLREAADDVYSPDGPGLYLSTQAWLRRRADRLEKGEERGNDD